MPCKVCPECGEGGMGVRTLKCKSCGYVFMKGKADKPKKPKKPPKIKFEVEDDFDVEEKVEDFSRKNKATKKYILKLDDDEKLTIEKLVRNCKPFEHTFDDKGKLTMYGSVYIVERGMDECTHKRAPVLPCHGVFAKIVANPKDGTLSVWVLEEDGEPDRVYLNAVI